jgi:predicted N-acetyltransferase YhbS
MIIERIPEWQLQPADEAQIAALLARCFPTDFGGRSFFQIRQHLRLAHRTEGRIIGHMALQFRAMRIGSRLITVAGLADVATDPDHRGKGIASGLLQTALAEARTSPAECVLLFGTAALYHAAGFRPVTNPMVWMEARGARTHAIHREPAESLMVLPLRDTDWDATARLDLLGPTF